MRIYLDTSVVSGLFAEDAPGIKQPPIYSLIW